ncbi:PREDICTED: protein NDR1-like [Ipomoea nil]|uniref:protein NDR1-like n=1 Tax=Ipomoea nil TaxID=35883 RepID=UPI000900D0D4|nr:PREDICTED: protein NDR1-like [Ipomoea nil]
MSDSGHGSGCFKCCFRFILTSGLTALFVWLSLRTTKPSCSISAVYLPALNTSGASNATRSNHTLYFTINLKNKMKDKGVRYDEVRLSFYYGANTSVPIGNYTVPSFYQGHGKDADKLGNLTARGVPWEAAFRAVSNGSKPVFRMDLYTRVRYKIVFWYTKRHNFMVENTTVEVNNSGKNSGTRQRRSFHAPAIFSVTLFVLVLLL